ncbi:MAG TPA: transketolase [Candidatus Egerieimonas intestinavium]|uniref:Transketolase n=1 Tax=Candidatus Egerieimonas intestinavium TaxID=2840777 RepID=A0A9D1ELK8_9FIRM|nr:transketolase [Candidatus Egerieimonas intestinavium]
MEHQQLEALCRQMRRDILEMIGAASSGHPGGSLSAVELIAGIYAQMRVDPRYPEDPDRDRFILSKGHAAPCYYAVLGELGFFDKNEFQHFRQLHSILQGHPDAKKVPGVDASTGSLGQGVSVAVGMALGAKTAGKASRVYTLLGDGELQEGQVWEACTAAAHYGLDNLTIVIDNNGLQIDGTNDQVMSLGNLRLRFEALGMDVIELSDGNDLSAVCHALAIPPAYGKPRCIIAHTVKGKGVSFMENQVGWHGKAPSPQELQMALKELEGSGDE